MIKLHFRFVLTTCFVLISFSAYTQITIAEPQADDEIYVFDCYQTYFIGDDLMEVKKVEVDGKEIQFEYIPDKKQLILHDYKGKGKITCYGTANDGANKEYNKTSCYIDPCDHAL